MTTVEDWGWVRVRGVLRAPDGLREPKTRELAEYKRPHGGSVRPVAPCGTASAYQRHNRRGEKCQRCEIYKAMNATRAGTR